MFYNCSEFEKRSRANRVHRKLTNYAINTFEKYYEYGRVGKKKMLNRPFSTEFSDTVFFSTKQLGKSNVQNTAIYPRIVRIAAKRKQKKKKKNYTNAKNILSLRPTSEINYLRASILFGFKSILNRNIERSSAIY